MQKALNHAGIPSKIEIFLKQKIQNIFLQKEKNPASRRDKQQAKVCQQNYIKAVFVYLYF